MNLEWLKKHKAAAIGGGIALLLVLYLLFRSSSGSSSNSLSSAIAQQNAGQEQMAEENAQLSASSEQTQAELAAQEYETQASEQEEQDQTVGGLAAEIIPDQLESGIYSQEISAEENEQSNLIPLEEQALDISTQGNRAVTGTNELALLLGEGNVGSFNSEASSSTASTTQPVDIVLSGLSNAANNVTSGLFG